MFYTAIGHNLFRSGGHWAFFRSSKLVGNVVRGIAKVALPGKKRFQQLQRKHADHGLSLKF